jgi:cytochrome P450
VVRQTVAFHRYPLGFLGQAQQRHGDVFSIRLLTARPLVVCGDPDSVGLKEPMRLGEWVVPAEASVLMPIALIQRDPRIWPEPDEFRPERWLSADAPERFYFPFGGGARRCVGEPLAMAEIRTVIPTILRRLALRPLWPEPERMVVRGTVLVPHRSLLVTATDV